MTDVVVGIDASTTACKVIAFDREGRALAEGRSAYPLQQVGSDGFEQDPKDWWRALGEASRSMARADEHQVVALCVTHQRETAVLVDHDGEPVARAVVWMDKRCAATVEAFDGDRERIAAITGKPVCTTPSAFKLRERLEAGAPPGVAGLREVHGFLVERLVGERVTATASAGPTGLVDLVTGAWDVPTIAAVLGEVACAWTWPALVSPGARLGGLTPGAAEHLGLASKTPVIAGAGDGQCAGLGAGIVAPGRAYLNLGTAVVSGVIATDYVHDPGFRTMLAPQPGHYVAETDLQGGTFTLTWLVETLLGGDETRRAALEAQAADLPAGADGLLLVPYLAGVMNPYWDDTATGLIAGLRGAHGPGHLYRAVLEGIALEQRFHLAAVVGATGIPLEEVVVMGGGSRSDLWCQVVADVLGVRVRRASTPDATALGAAMIASVGAGWFRDVAAAAEAMGGGLGATFTPRPVPASFYDRLYEEVYAGLYAAIAPRMQRLWRLRQTQGEP